MKKILSLTLFLGLTFAVAAQSTYRYDVKKVVDDVYILKPIINSYRWVTANIVVIVNEDDILVVDSGLLPSAAAAAIAEIKKISDKPVRFLVNTHWHGDHWQGNEEFRRVYPEIDIIASTRGRESIQRNGQLWVKQFYIKYLQMMVDNYERIEATGKRADGSDMPESSMKELREGLPQVKADLEAVKKLRPTEPNLVFSDKLTLYRGAREIQFHYLGVGNTVGDAVVYLPREKILIPGDLVVYPSPYESGAFSKEWVETSKKLRAFDFNYLLPGHGEVQTDAAYLDYLNALFAEIIKQMNAAFYEGNISIEEAKKVVTHQTVTDELLKNPSYSTYAKQLDPSFVPAAIDRSYQQAREGKL